MAYMIWTEFVCDNCAQAGGGEFVRSGQRIRNKDALARLREIKWVFTHDRVWCSKKCFDEFLGERVR